MKKIILIIIAVVAISLTSCNFKKTTDQKTVDSTAVKVEVVDTVNTQVVDTTAVK
jgi:hypothetical protein